MALVFERLPEWTFPLRAWQRAASADWLDRRPDDALIVATPGAGKTKFAARIVHALLRDRSIERAIVVVPREHLKSQVAIALAECGVRVDHKFANATGALANDVHGAVVSYQQVAFAPHVYRSISRKPTLVVLDEIHHAADAATWGSALRTAFGSAQHRIALSGTPFRSDGLPIPFVQYEAGVSLADYGYDYAEALRDGVCRPLVFPLHGGVAEWISRDGRTMLASFETALESRAMEAERLRTALTQESWIGDVLMKAHTRLLELRAEGDRDCAGLVVAMNQDHARFIASLMKRRLGVEPTLVVSEDERASLKIKTFGRSRDPWIVAVHMVSEGVDIPRLRVGVYASNVNTEMYFRQFCGRFVRTQKSAPGESAYVYLPDDPALGALASRIAVDVRTALRFKREFDELAAAQRTQTEASDALGEYASISASATESRTLDFGPLFNRERWLNAGPPKDGEATKVAAVVKNDSHYETIGDAKESLRKSVAVLVSRVSDKFNVDYKKVHATLNTRFGGPIGTATVDGLAARAKTAQRWLANNVYDGLR